jgi:hypothetical protein
MIRTDKNKPLAVKARGPGKFADMCNLYSMTTTHEAMAKAVPGAERHQSATLARDLPQLPGADHPAGHRRIFAGKAGTGFDLKTGHDLVARLRKLERAGPTFAEVRAPINAAPAGRSRS